MTRRHAWLGLAFVICFLAGGIVGGVVVFSQVSKPMAQLFASASLSMTGNEAYVRYRYATYPVAKTSLLRQVDELKSLRGFAATEENGNAFDIGMTYARLAVAAERATQPEDAATYMTLAEAALATQRPPYDRAQIRAAVQRVDTSWDSGLGHAATVDVTP